MTPRPRLLPLAALAFGAVLALCAPSRSPAWAEGSSPARSHSLERENAALKERLRKLEAENQKLRSSSSAAESPAETTAPRTEAPPLDLSHADTNDHDLGFLNLGVKRDYLKAERGRIVEQLQQFIPPLYEPVFPFHAYTLPPGAIRMKIGTRIFNNHHDFGTDERYSFFFKDVTVRNLFVDYDFFYGFELPTRFGKDLVLNVNVPYKRTSIRGTGHPFRVDPLVMSMNGDAEGLGDISFTLKKKWLDQGNWPLNLASFLGVITPTGRHHEEFFEQQSLRVGGQPMPAPPIDVFSARAGQRLIPNGSQPGTGAWGLRVGAAATRQFERSALHTGIIANIFADNSDGITPGNEINFGLGYVVPPFASDWLSLDFSIFGRHKDAERFPGMIMHPLRDPTTGGPIMNPDGTVKIFTTRRPGFEHGTVLFASPSLIFVPIPQARIIVSPAFRIREPNQGPSPEFQLAASMEITF